MISTGVERTPVESSFAKSAAHETHELQHIASLCSEIYRRLVAISAAQAATVLPLQGPGFDQLSPSQTRAVVSEIRRLHETRRQLIRRATRLQRVHSGFGVSTKGECFLKSCSNSGFVDALDRPYCSLPLTVISSLRATADRIAAIDDNVSIRQKLLFCHDLSKLGCCTLPLAASVLKQLLEKAFSLQLSDVALGVQVVASLLKQPGLWEIYQESTSSSSIIATHRRKRALASHDQLRLADMTVGRRRRIAAAVHAADGLASPACADQCCHSPKSDVLLQSRQLVVPAGRDEEVMQKLCLITVTRLLEILASSGSIRKKIPVQTCVRTADACAQMAKERPSTSEPPGSPATFVAALTTASHELSLLLGRYDSIGRESGHYLTGGVTAASPKGKPWSVDATFATDEEAPSARRGRPPDRTSRVAGVAQVSTVHVAGSDGGAGVVMAALWRRIQQSLAPRVAVLLLREACSHKFSSDSEQLLAGHGWSGAWVGIAMSAAATGAPTQSTRRKLLLKLFRRLQTCLFRVPQQQQLGACASGAMAAAGRLQTAASYDDQLVRNRPSEVGIAPSSLAAVCRSLASSGVSIGEPELALLFGAICESLHTNANTLTSYDGLEEFIKSPPDEPDLEPGSLAVDHTHLQHASSEHGSETSVAVSSKPASDCLSVFSAFYKEWCIVLWAGAKILKASVASLSPEESAVLAAKVVLVRQLLTELVARLPAAEPQDVAKICEALRLLLLLEGAEASSRPTIAALRASWKPLLLRQRLLPANELTWMLQTLGRHFVQHSDCFESLEILEVLRLFVQLDLLYYLNIQAGARTKCANAMDMEAQGQCHGEKQVPCSGKEREVVQEVTHVGFLRCALLRLFELINSQRNDVALPARTCRYQNIARDQMLQQCAVSSDFTLSVLRSVALRYPDDVQRLPSDVRRGVIRLLEG